MFCLTLSGPGKIKKLNKSPWGRSGGRGKTTQASSRLPDFQSCLDSIFANSWANDFAGLVLSVAFHFHLNFIKISEVFLEIYMDSIPLIVCFTTKHFITSNQDYS